MYKSRIICIHGINRSLTRERFIRYIKWVKRLGFRFVSLDEILEQAPKRAIALTVDDAYKNCVTDLLPILIEYQIKATLFVPVGLLDLPANHPDLLANDCYPDESTMSWLDVRYWQTCKQSIGFHTFKHINLYREIEQRIESDFITGMLELRKHGINTEWFAYPMGFLPRNRQHFEKLLIKYKIKYAFSVNWGSVDNKERFYINRIILGDNEPCWWSLLKTTGLMDWYFYKRRQYEEQIK